MRVCGGFCRRTAALLPGRADAAGRRGGRARPPLPPPGRRRRPRSGRRARPPAAPSTASASAPPEVTTSSSRQTSSPCSNGPSSRFAVPYSLARVADDHERQPRRERGRRRERDRAERGAGEPDRLRLVLPHGCGEALAQRAEQLGQRLEAVLVEVPARALAGAEQEIALEQGVLAQAARRARPSQTTGRERGRAARPLRARPARASPSSRRRSGAAPARGRGGGGRRRAASRRPRAGAQRLRVLRIGLRLSRPAASASASAAARPAPAGRSGGRRRRARRSAPAPVVATMLRPPSRTTKTLPCVQRDLQLRAASAARP